MINEVDNTQNRINELIAELSECRSDERDAQNQMLQVLSVAVTVLGILLGASFFGGELIDNNTARLIFSLSIFVFCAAFLYILLLGIKNILRYYYIQRIEDQLHLLVRNPDDDSELGSFLHWNTFSGPIITRNSRHIASSHTLIYFVSYSLATLFAGVFSILLIIAQFQRIEDKQWYDFAGIAFAIVVMIIVLFLFFYISRSARACAQFAHERANVNLKVRLGEETSGQVPDTTHYSNFIHYLIYPKRKCPQKPALIVCGFLGGFFFTGFIDDPINLSSICNLILAIFVFDFLAYQARYQINDLRGIEEDDGRLITRSDTDTSKRHKIRTSLAVASIRMVLAVAITLALSGSMRVILSVFLIMLLISTILYEAARRRESPIAVFFWVGSGYPLRFFLGLLTALQDAKTVISIPLCTCFFLTAALWSYGCCASISAWVNEVVKKMPEWSTSNKTPEDYFSKRHFATICEKLRTRFGSNEKFPLQEAGNLSDPWSITYITAFVCISIIKIQLALTSTPLLYIELFTIVCFATPNFLQYKYRILPCALGISGIMVGLLSVYRHIVNPYWYLFLCLVQLVFTGTYSVLRYQMQLKAIIYSIMHSSMTSFLSLIIGETARRYAFPEETDTSKERKR